MSHDEQQVRDFVDTWMRASRNANLLSPVARPA
jgi:hypothetical protein